MIQSDPKTKKFYMEMGYTEQQFNRAYQYSLNHKIHILDALTMAANNPSKQMPTKQQNNYRQSNPSQKSPKSSFLTPFSKIKQTDYEVLYSRNNKHNLLNMKYELRDPNNPVGLLNVSNCCYLNSLLQCYFLMDDFKIALLSAEPLQNIDQILGQSKTKLKRVKSEYDLLRKLKYFFTVMALTSKKYLDPTEVLQNLVDSVGQKLTYGEQKDLSEINIMIIERLSEGLTFSKKYFEEEVKLQQDTTNTSSFIMEQPDQKNTTRYNSMFNPKQGTIKNLFYGTKAEYYEKGEMKEEPPIISDFTGIILNPRFGTLYNALDEQFNFTVEINGKEFKKQIFIRDQPQYLFMYINRTQYDREQRQMLKNEEKISFDFVLYLDRYLQKYHTEKSQKDQRIQQLIKQKNKIKEQINCLQILFKKVEDCYNYVLLLDGWEDKFPAVEEFLEEQTKLEKRLARVEQELKLIESREEEYHLMYIFVHRGDAVSGHYWGYGRNEDKWYRFDINCRKIAQEQIIIDMEKSAASPYALLYVKSQNLPKFSYNYYLQRPKKSEMNIDFRQFLDSRLSEDIIKENFTMHQQIKIRNNENIKNRTLSDYVERFIAIKKVDQVKKTAKQAGKLSKLQIFNNFSLFLYSKGQMELYKFSVFQQSLLAATTNKITIQGLMNEQDLLNRVQKKFKKQCKGEFHLKNYAIVGKEIERYYHLQQQYHLSLFEVIWAVSLANQFDKYFAQISKVAKKEQQFINIDFTPELSTPLKEMLRLLIVRNGLRKSQQYKKANNSLQEPLYTSLVCNEIVRLVMLQLVMTGFKFESIQSFLELTDVQTTQITVINANNALSINHLYEVSSFPIEEAQEIIAKFFRKNVKRSSVNEKGYNERASSFKKSVVPLQKTNSVASVGQQNANRVPSENKKKQSKLVGLDNSSLIKLDPKQTWKVQQLDGIRINFDFNQRVLSFLSKLGKSLEVYKRNLAEGKAFSNVQLKKLGVVLNQPPFQQSLI